MKRRYLRVLFSTDNSTCPKVEISEQPNLFVAQRIRSSPIFRVLTEEDWVPDFSKSVYIGFYFCRDVFVTMSELLSVSKRIGRCLWFSQGRASIIVISEDEQIITEVKEKVNNKLMAFESWIISSGNIINRKEWINKTKFITPNIEEYNMVSAELRFILDEFRHSYYTLLNRCSIYLPERLDYFVNIGSIVNELIKQLNYFQNINSSPFQGDHSTKNKNIFADNPILRQERIGQITSEIVELNSALSYVISQGFSGIVPILEHESHVRCSSLLGIGSAFDTLLTLYEHVSSILREYPMDQIIEKEYVNINGVDIFKYIPNYNANLWKEAEPNIPLLLKNLKRDDAKDSINHLVYFSGRLGFREATHSISAALPSLRLACTKRWSLITLSHEYMHAHVRNLLATILEDLPRTTSPGRLEYLFNLFTQYDINNQSTRINLRDSLALILICYANSVLDNERVEQLIDERLVNSDKQDIKNNSRSFFQDDLFRYFQSGSNWKLINEIIVHVLDFQYFYHGRVKTYIHLLWSSWSAVPQVFSEIDQYILRTLAAISSDILGSNTERFNRAYRLLIETFVEMQEGGYDTILIREALRIMNDEKEKQHLLIHYISTLYLVDSTRIFLHCSEIHGSIMHDKNVIQDEDNELIYPMSPGEFPGYNIDSPVSFIIDRARRCNSNSNNAADDESDEYDSAWMFLVCNSANASKRSSEPCSENNATSL